MTLTHLGYGLSWVICLGIIMVGARFLLAPRPSDSGSVSGRTPGGPGPTWP